MINYQFNDKFQIVEVNVSGVITIKDIIDHYYNISKDDSLPNNLKEIIDCRNAQFDIDLKNIDLTYKSVKKALEAYDTIKEAILVDKPFETVVAMLFVRINANSKNYCCRVFSTEDASYNWLNLRSQKKLVQK